MTDVRELIRCRREGMSQRETAATLGIARNTVARYESEIGKRGWLQAGSVMPSEFEVSQMVVAMYSPGGQTLSQLEPHREWIKAQREARASILKVQRDLEKDLRFKCSYAALWSFVRQMEGPTLDVTLRVETGPGEEGQVDFGYAGWMYDPLMKKLRKAWLFVMTLSYSRHMFVRHVFDQTTQTWLRLHREAFEFFGGVPGRIKLDNLKAAIIRASVEDPVVQKAYRELAEYYGFLISPCQVRKPQHKGKVESGVKYVKGAFLTGTKADYTHERRHIGHANTDVIDWVLNEAGLRDHGTTHWRPLVEYERVERGALRMLPGTPYEIAVWTQTKVHRDCHIVLGGSYYSAPYRLVGQIVQVRVSDKAVQIHAGHECVVTHTLLATKGLRVTVPAHLPEHRAKGLATGPVLREEAAEIGFYTALLANSLLDEKPIDRTRVVQRLIGLASKHDKAILERACKQAYESGDFTTATVRNLIVMTVTGQPAARTACADAPHVFARPIQEIAPAHALAAFDDRVIDPPSWKLRKSADASVNEKAVSS